MSEEGKNTDEVVEIQPDEKGKYPETVSWSQYVKVKESIGGKLETERQKVSSLEEKLKSAVNPDEFTKVKQELDDTKTKLHTTEGELSTIKEQTTTEKRAVLVKRGVPEEEVKDMSVAELNAALKVAAHIKGAPAPDLGGGGGSGELKGSPLDLAVRAYEG